MTCCNGWWATSSSLAGSASTHALAEAIEVEDTAEFAALHSNGARSVFYATLANTLNAPVTLDISTEKATLSLRGDLTVTYDDGRSEVVRNAPWDRAAAPTGVFRMPC